MNGDVSQYIFHKISDAVFDVILCDAFNHRFARSEIRYRFRMQSAQ